MEVVTGYPKEAANNFDFRATVSPPADLLPFQG
jgi:hypothetical protein